MQRRSTAFCKSVTSARVGTGFSIMLSSALLSPHLCVFQALSLSFPLCIFWQQQAAATTISKTSRPVPGSLCFVGGVLRQCKRAQSGCAKSRQAATICVALMTKSPAWRWFKRREELTLRIMYASGHIIHMTSNMSPHSCCVFGESPMSLPKEP